MCFTNAGILLIDSIIQWRKKKYQLLLHKFVIGNILIDSDFTILCIEVLKGIIYSWMFLEVYSKKDIIFALQKEFLCTFQESFMMFVDELIDSFLYYNFSCIK